MSEKSSGKGRRVLSVVLKTIGTLLIIAVLAVLIPLTVPNFMGYRSYDVISGSMEPTIPVGSMILVESVNGVDIQDDDIIAFYSNGIVVTHRVTHNNTFEGILTTKGDANQSEDIQKTAYKDLIGRVAYHIPYLGAIGAYVSTPSGKLFFFEMIFLGAILHVIANRIS